MTFDLFLHLLWHSFLDTIKVFPVILIIYILIEFIESKSAGRDKLKNLLSKKGAPFFGGVIGVIPQCGFSVIATKLYQSGYILLGTLLAVYFATSDEAIPILFSNAVENPSLWVNLLILIAIKLSYAILIGFIVNAVIKKFYLNKSTTSVSENKVVNDHDHDHEHEEDKELLDEGCCHHHVENKPENFGRFLIHPLLHSLKIIAYIFVINLVFSFLFELIGEDKISNFLSANIYLQPLLSAVVGVIPNCASSVIITQLYAGNILSLGATVCGLTINSGLGVAVLIKDRKNIKKSLLIIALMFVLSLVIGYLVTFIEVLI